MKTIQLVLVLLLSVHLYSQEICDDLITYDEWEFVTYEAVDWNYGDTIGYFADGNLPIIAVLDYSDVPTGSLFMDESHPGLYGYNMGVQFNFLGNNQTVTMQIYVDPGVTYDQFGFYVNESDSILLDADFPIIADGIAINLEDLGLLDDTYILLELSFTGLINSIIYQPSASGII